MQNFKSDASTDRNGLDVEEPFAAPTGAKNKESKLSTSDNKIDLEEAKRNRAKKSTPRKRRSKAAKKNVDITSAAVDCVDNVASQPTEASTAAAGNELDFSVGNDDDEYEEIEVPVVVKKKKGHNHEDGVLCDFCKLNDNDFAAAYALLKNSEAKRKQAVDANKFDAEMPPVLRPMEEEVETRFSKKNLIRAGIIAAIAIAAFIWNEESQYTKATSLADFGNRAYVTAERDGSIKFLHNAISLTTDGSTTVSKAKKWQDNWRDQLDLAFGAPENTLWLKETPAGFAAQDGTVFYAPNSPEIKTIDTINALKSGAEKMYAAQGHYPTNDAELVASCNIGDVKNKSINVTNEEGSNLVVGQGETAFEHALKNGQLFGREKGAPNLISCLSVKSEPNISSDFNSYGWKTNAFFIHGFDSKGNLLRGASGSPVMLMAMKNGRPIFSAPAQMKARPDKPTSVWIYDGELPNQGSIKFGFMAAAMLVITMIAVLVGKRVHDSVMNH